MRIIVNSMLSTQPNVKESKDVVSLSKLIHFYKYESEISLETGRAFIMNRRGQILEIDIDKFNVKRDPQNLYLFIKKAEPVFLTSPVKLNESDIPALKKMKTTKHEPVTATN